MGGIPADDKKLEDKNKFAMEENPGEKSLFRKYIIFLCFIFDFY